MTRPSFTLSLFAAAFVPAIAMSVSHSPPVCAQVLAGTLPAAATNSDILGFLERRGQGEAVGPVLADYLQDHYGAVPGIDAATAMLRDPAAFPFDHHALEVTTFWQLARMLPTRLAGEPLTIAGVTFDGFPILHVRPTYFFDRGAADATWLCDVRIDANDLPAFPGTVFSTRGRRIRTVHFSISRENESAPATGDDIRSRALAALIGGFESLRSLALDVRDEDSPVVTPLLRLTPSLERLSLSVSRESRWTRDERRRWSERVRHVVARLPNLNALALSQVPISLAALHQVSSSLRDLRLENMFPRIRFYRLSQLLSLLPSIEVLQLTFIEGIDGITTSLPSLQHLAVYYGQWEEDDVRGLQRLQQLKSLRVVGPVTPLTTLLGALPRQVQRLTLERLHPYPLPKVHASTGPTEGDLALGHRLAALSSLTHLTVRDPALAGTFLDRAPRDLEALGIGVMQPNGDEALARLFARSERLRHLVLHDVDSLHTALELLPGSVEDLTLANDRHDGSQESMLRRGLERLGNLQRLSLDRVSNWKSVLPSRLLRAVASTLRHLQVYPGGSLPTSMADGAFDPELPTQLARFVNLRSLELTGELFSPAMLLSLPPTIVRVANSTHVSGAGGARVTVPGEEVWRELRRRVPDLRWLRHPAVQTEAIATQVRALLGDGTEVVTR